MYASVQSALAPVRRRQRLAFVVRATVYGLLAGGMAGIVDALVQWRVSGTVSAWVAVEVAAWPVLGLLVGLLWPRPWRAAAAAVDAHYRLKDRSTTALEFLAKPNAGDLHQLQITDALAHLTRVEPKAVVPIRSPRALPYALGVLAAAAVLPFVLPRPQEANAGPSAPLPQVVAEAEKIQERLSELEEVARQEDNKDLKELVEKLKQKAEELLQPDVDEKEALAKLSEMQTAIQSQMAQFNTALVDGQLASLGAALTSATALEGAGKALQEAKLDKAAKELEKIEDPQLDRKQAKTVEEKLKQVAQAMGEVGLGQMSAAVSDLGDSVKGGKGKVKKATRVLAREVKNQARRRRINDLLNAELDRLKESKANCQCNSLVKGKRPEKSTSPSSTFGATTSGNVIGDKTKLLGQRNQVDLTGTPGEGPSDVETTASPEARQRAQRGYKDVYQKYRKMSEAVLDSEPIPLGHRQTIRRYFELIRPQNSDLPDKKDMPERGKP